MSRVAARSRGPARSSAPRRKSAAVGAGSSLLESAYEAIKHRITTCAFRPGEYLNEAEVSATLGIGRTPVHQALDRLRVEGLVEVMPRKGILVKPVSLDEVLRTIEVRLLNEVHGARLAAERASAGEIDEMTAILDRAETVLPARDTETLMRLDRSFHGVIARASRNDVLADVLGRLHDRSLRFWVISLNAPGHHAAVHEQHLAILDALRARDAERAATAMRDHIDAFRRNLMQAV